MACGIYKIQSTIYPDRIYIGSSANIIYRWSKHKGFLRRNKHHSLILQHHVDKYGLDDLLFSVIAICEKEDLMPENGIIWIENCFIGAYRYGNSKKPYFNVSEIAGKGRLGIKHTEEARLKMKKPKGTMPDWHKKKISESLKGVNTWMKGRKLSEKTKQKISESEKGKKNHMFGKKMSEDSRKKMSDAKIGCKSWNKGRKTPEEVKRKQSEAKMGDKNARFGKHHSAETKRKIGDANRIKMKEYHQRQKSIA